VYDAVYFEPGDFEASFACFGSTPISGSRARQEVTLSQRFSATVASPDQRASGLGGWTLDVHPAYDVTSGALRYGNGTTRSNAEMRRSVIVPTLIETVAGGAALMHSGDGRPAVLAGFSSPYGLALAPDGGYYVTDAQASRVRHVGPDGIIRTVAGSGSLRGYGGDGGPATSARLNYPTDVAIGPDGSLYITDVGASRVAPEPNQRVRRIGPD